MSDADYHFGQEAAPFVTTTAELWSDYSLRLLTPPLDTPCLCLKILNLQPEIRHRLGRVCLIYEGSVSH